MIEKLLIVVSVTTLAMLSPGPDMALVMRNTLTGSQRRGGLTALGVLSGNLVHIGYCVFGIALLLSQSPTAYTALRIASAAYLVYLGTRSLRNVTGTGAAGASADTRHPYGEGFINNLLNPKGSLFYLGVFSQVITPETSRWQTISLIAAMLSVSAAFWVLFVHTLHLPVIRVGLAQWDIAINRVFGVVLIVIGASVVFLK